MPQIIISNSYNTAFLAKKAGLGNAWGSMINPEDPTNTQIFAFETNKFTAVEAAMASFPVDYLAQKKLDRLEQLAEKRATEELKGPMGLKLDDKTVARLTAASTGLMLDQSILTIKWEITRGVFVTLSRETILQLAVLAMRHVQACFNHVADVTNVINAIDLDPELDALEALDAALEDLLNVDISTGWPVAPQTIPS